MDQISKTEDRRQNLTIEPIDSVEPPSITDHHALTQKLEHIEPEKSFQMEEGGSESISNLENKFEFGNARNSLKLLNEQSSTFF